MDYVDIFEKYKIGNGNFPAIGTLAVPSWPRGQGGTLIRPWDPITVLPQSCQQLSSKPQVDLGLLLDIICTLFITSPAAFPTILPFCPSFSMKRTQTQALGTFASEAGLCTHKSVVWGLLPQVPAWLVHHILCVLSQRCFLGKIFSLFLKRSHFVMVPCSALFFNVSIFCTLYIYTAFVVCPV